MVCLGYAESKEQAIREYINRLRFRSEYVRPEAVISSILDSGGIPVLAHPSFGDGDQLILDEEMDRRLCHLMDFGLQGVEAFYSGFTPSCVKSCCLLRSATVYTLPQAVTIMEETSWSSWAIPGWAIPMNGRKGFINSCLT